MFIAIAAEPNNKGKQNWDMQNIIYVNYISYVSKQIIWPNITLGLI